MNRDGQRLSPKYVMRKYATFYLLSQVLGVTRSEELITGSHGKPALAGRPDCYFNLSHGRDYTVLAVCDQPVGIDIEEIPAETTAEKRAKGLRKRQLLAERSFPDRFRNEYFQADADRETAVFTRLWTQFEAILKGEGTGLSLSLKDNPQLLEKWKLQNLSLSDHIITVALKEDFTISLPDGDRHIC